MELQQNKRVGSCESSWE